MKASLLSILVICALSILLAFVPRFIVLVWNCVWILCLSAAFWIYMDAAIFKPNWGLIVGFPVQMSPALGFVACMILSKRTRAFYSRAKPGRSSEIGLNS